VKLGATAWTLVSIGLALAIWAGFNPTASAEGQGTFQYVERIPWISAIQVDYFLALDGLSLPLVLLTTVMAPIAALASLGVTERVKAHYAMLLLLEAAMLGYFVALNFFFFFIFWEFSLVPAFFLIQLWGRENRRYAAFNFFVYTMAGSVGMLLLFQIFYQATALAGIPTFDLVMLGRLGQGLEGAQNSLQQILFRWCESVGITNHTRCCIARSHSGRSLWRSRSSWRCGRSIPGCRAPTARPPRPARSCSRR
jgi:NADH-quinone oxidoreductase subunit M